MEDFLSYLYRGEIHPNEEPGRYLGKMRSLEIRSSKILEELKDEISEKAKANLEKYIDCQQELCFYIEQDAFCRGVSFTTKFLVSALD